MTTLYNACTSIDHTGTTRYRITKFTDGDVESSYLTTLTECECPAGVRPSCRHRQMLPMMIAQRIVNTPWFWDFDRMTVVTFEGFDAGPMRDEIERDAEPTLCEDEGCPQSHTEHVCLTTPAPSTFRRRL